MGIDYEATIWAVCAALVLCVALVFMSSCEEKSNRVTGEQFSACVGAGGTWIPTTSSKAAVCLAK